MGRVHPNRNNPDAPLFVTNRRRETGSKPEEKKLIHKPLDQPAIMNVVHKTAKLAGITKRVYPDLFRHTCATELSKDFFEAELRNFLGWLPESVMVSVYVNLSGEQMKNAVMAGYGIEEQNKKEPKVKKCPRCKSITTPKFRFCDICGLPLANVEINPEIDHSAGMKEMSSVLAKYPERASKSPGEIPEVLI